MTVKIDIRTGAPDIAHKIYAKLVGLDFIELESTSLVIQLTYRENHSIFYLNRLSKLIFDEFFIEIEQENGSVSYLNYEEILEYNIININDLIEWEII